MKANGNGHIYAIQAEHVHLIKLGYSENPGARLADLKTGSAVKLTLLAVWRGTVADEQALHVEFGAYRSHGEWFQPAPSVIARVLARNEASPAYLAELNGSARRQLVVATARPDAQLSAVRPRRLRAAAPLAAPSGFDLRFRVDGSVRVYECLGNGHRPKRRVVGSLSKAEVEALSRLPVDEQRERVRALAEVARGDGTLRIVGQ